MNPLDMPQVDVEIDDSAEQSQIAASIDRLDELGASLAKKRDEWIRARSSSGVDKRMREDADQYHGRDNSNKLASQMMANVEAGYPVSLQQTLPTRSRIFIGITRTRTNANEARLSDILLQTDERNFGLEAPATTLVDKARKDKRPAVDVQTGQPMMSEDGQPLKNSDLAEMIHKAYQQKAEAMEDEIASQLNACDYNAEQRKMIHSSALYGTGVLKGPVVMSRVRKKWQTQTDPETGNQAYSLEIEQVLTPASFSVDPRNCFPDPACGNNIHNGSGHFEIDRLTKRRVRELLKQPQYIKSQIEKVLEEEPKQSALTVDLSESIAKDLAAKEVYEKWEYWGELEAEDLKAAGVDIGDDATQTLSACVEMIGDVVVRAYLNPLEDGELPYDYFPWEEVTDSPFGYGVPYLMRAQQQVTNAAWRQMMDNAGITSGPQIILKPSMVKPLDKRWELTNRKLWMATDDVQDVRTAFASVEFNSRQGELENILKLSEAISDQETDTPQIMKGDGGAAPETVGAMQMQMHTASVVLRRRVKRFDDYITKPHIRRYYDYNMLYSERDDIKGDFEVVARGSNALMIRDIQNQAFINLLNLAANPVFAPMIDPKELFQRALRAQHVDPTDIMRTDEEIQKLQQMAMQNQKPDPRVQAAEMRANADMERTKAQNQEAMAELQLRAQEAERDRQYHLERLQLEREIALMNLSTQQNISLEKIKASLASVALRERTKRDLTTQELQLKHATGSGI